jgi:hypothetical protein
VAEKQSKQSNAGRGGKRTGAGRKAGVHNKASIARQAEIAASGQTPLDFLLSVMRNDDCDMAVRQDAAKAAAPYVHPKLASVEHKGDQSLTVTIKQY